MNLIPLFLGATLAVLGWFALDYAKKSAPEQTPPDLKTTNTPSLSSVQLQLEIVAQNLEVPWSIIFTSPTRLLVSERPGRIRSIELGETTTIPLIGFTEISTKSEEGLMGLAIDPEYETNAFLYACFAYPKNSGLVDKVVRLVDKDNLIQEDRTIIDNIPAAQFHAGCRLQFGPDKKLYISTGDSTNRQIAQNKASLGGKILRLNPDGTIPDDNPFPKSPIFALGLRNPQGMTWDPSGAMYAVDHGPSGFDGPRGGDEVNHIVKAGNYGWPIVSHDKKKDGLIDPLLVFTPAIAPGSILSYHGSTFPQFTGNLLFTGLVGEGIFHADLSNSDPDTIVSHEKVKEINVGRVRDIVEGPDGFIYFSTSNRDGRGDPKTGDDKIYRIIPKPL